jgi:hypothetical protein
MAGVKTHATTGDVLEAMAESRSKRAEQKVASENT